MFCLIDKDTRLIVWGSHLEPSVGDSVKFNDADFACYNKNNSEIVELDIQDFDEFKYTYINGSVVLNPGYSPPLQYVPVPQAVTMRQARLALFQSGLLNAVTAAVINAGDLAKITWEYSSEVERNNGLVPTMAAALGMTDSQIDNLFILAATL